MIKEVTHLYTESYKILMEKSGRSEVKSFSRVRLCDPTDCSLPGSLVHGIFQARVLEWAAIGFSRKEVKRGSFLQRPKWEAEKKKIILTGKKLPVYLKIRSTQAPVHW